MTNYYLNADHENEIIGGLVVEDQETTFLDKKVLDRLQEDFKLPDHTMLEIRNKISDLEGEWFENEDGREYEASDSDIESLISDIDEIIGGEIDLGGNYLNFVNSLRKQDPEEQILEKAIKLLINNK